MSALAEQRRVHLPRHVFYRTLKGEFDLVVAQYHDQGHIPTKLIAFDTTVRAAAPRVQVDSVPPAGPFALAGRGDSPRLFVVDSQ